MRSLAGVVACVLLPALFTLQYWRNWRTPDASLDKLPVPLALAIATAEEALATQPMLEQAPVLWGIETYSELQRNGWGTMEHKAAVQVAVGHITTRRILRWRIFASSVCCLVAFTTCACWVCVPKIPVQQMPKITRRKKKRSRTVLGKHLGASPTQKVDVPTLGAQLTQTPKKHPRHLEEPQCQTHEKILEALTAQATEKAVEAGPGCWSEARVIVDGTCVNSMQPGNHGCGNALASWWPDEVGEDAEQVSGWCDEDLEGVPERGQFVPGWIAVGDWYLWFKVFAPVGGDSKPLPLVVQLHGIGECGDDLQRHTEVGLGGMARTSDVPAFVLLPQLPRRSAHAGSWPGWSQEFAQRFVMRAVSMVQMRYRVDPCRISILGYSLGASAALTLAARFSRLFAAVAACAGTGQDYDWRARVWKAPRDSPGHVPIPAYIAHGDADGVIPYEHGVALAQSVSSGANLRFVTLKGAPHNCLEDALKGGMLEWLLGQVRNPGLAGGQHL